MAKLLLVLSLASATQALSLLGTEDPHEEPYPYPRIDDETQQKYFQKYTEDLWLLAQDMPKLKFLLGQLNSCEGRLSDVEAQLGSLEKDVTDNISDLRSNLKFAQLDIGTNSDAITTNSDAITTHSSNIATNLNKINTNIANINTNSDAITTHSNNNLDKINTNIANIKHNKDGINTPTVGVCGSQYSMSDTGTITYDSLITDLTTDDSTLDLSTGTYTIHTAGLYSVTWSASVGMDSGERAIIDLYEDGTQLAESFYYSYYGGSEHNIDAGSRTLLRHYCQGTQIRLGVITITADIRNVLFCVHLVQGQEC